MTCAELEILLCDYVDGTLRAEEKSALESHIAGCAACAELARDVAGVTAFIERVPSAEPPAELLTRIMHHAPDRRDRAQERPAWWRKFFGTWVEAVWQPRYAMGMAMTILSLSMLAKFAPVPVRQLRPADLDPVKVWQAVDDRTHRIWDRAMKYYDNMRLVIEIQSRLKEWTEQEAGGRGQEAESSRQKAVGSKQTPDAGGNERGSER